MFPCTDHQISDIYPQPCLHRAAFDTVVSCKIVHLAMALYTQIQHPATNQHINLHKSWIRMSKYVLSSLNQITSYQGWGEYTRTVFRCTRLAS